MDKAHHSSAKEAKMDPTNIAVIGSSGAIGRALADEAARRFPAARLTRFSRSMDHRIDYEDEGSLAQAATLAAEAGPLDLVLVATGILHDGETKPERALRELSAEKFQQLFTANCITPALIAKHFLPTMRRDGPALFMALSARVGSISDNRLGGWYSYRASKAALNMVIKNAAIELARKNDQAVVVGMHPGTVDSALSEPFQTSVPEGKLFTPAFSAGKILDVGLALSSGQSGKCFAWDGKEVLP